MKCFYHHDRDAVGSCKSCLRGVCAECAVPYEKGLACPGHCEEDVKSLIRLVENNLRLSPASSSLIRAQRRNGMASASFLIVMGFVFAGWGFAGPKSSFVVALGFLFIVYGLFLLARFVRLVAPKDPPPTQ